MKLRQQKTKKEAKPNAIADFILYQERRQKFKNKKQTDKMEIETELNVT